jgi:hypothetical protein
MDATTQLSPKIRAMRRSRYDLFAKAKAPRYVVLWDVQRPIGLAT